MITTPAPALIPSKGMSLSPSLRAPLLASLALLVVSPCALGQQTPPADQPAAAAPASKPDVLDEITINGVRKGDLIMPTSVTSTSAYGLDLGVLDTPRNNTVLSTTQLDALNISNPQGFSFLTASSYSDASFGVPNVPRIRGQYADVFFNGMRDSFTSNGYGAPISFNSVDQMDIVKGPASVQSGPGAGVGGAIDISTKLPNPSKFTGSAFLQLDTQQKRRLNLDVGGPASQNLSYRLSYTGDLSGSYYNGMYFHQESLYGVVVANITPKYSVQFNSEYVDARYRENDGINRVNQQLIDNGTYLTGAPPASAIQSFLTPVTLGNPTQLSREVIIDQAPGTSARATRYNAQLIQTYEVADNLTVVNNTFYNFINRYNVIPDYYADTAQASYTIENKTDVKFKFATPFSGLLMNHQIDAGASIRYAHVDTIQNFAAETVSVFDLTGSPTSWNVTDLQAGAGAFPYTAAFGSQQYGVPARGAFGLYLNSTINSNLTDVAAFLEHRIELTPVMSVLYGLRGDAVHLVESDPLGGPGLYAGLPATESTPWYGLANANVSPVYRPAPWMSTYFTYNFAQYVLPTGNDGAVGTFGVDPTSQLRQNTHLLEAGSKFDLLDKSLFVSAAVYEQTRSVSTGPGTDSTTAHIKGLELETNYQPGPRLFATASYSFMRTVLDTPAGFYNFPAQPGLNIDGAGVGALFSTSSFVPGQTFNDPGVPQHLFNFLVNYKDPSGWGLQSNLQVIGKIETTQSGQLNLSAMAASVQGFPGSTATTVPGILAGYVPQSVIANGGYYQSPTIPWQYTLNAAAFYKYNNYEFRFSIFNVTDRRNVTNDIPFYGNDFLTVNPPRSYAISIKAHL